MLDVNLSILLWDQDPQFPILLPNKVLEVYGTWNDILSTAYEDKITPRGITPRTLLLHRNEVQTWLRIIYVM